MRRPPSERTLLFLVGAVQFVNVLDFMMVMPLGPDFAAALGFPPSRLGLVGGAYTLAAAVAGVGGSAFLDRLDRRRALGGAMLGLVLATAAGGAATGLASMLASRLAAGAFGGPATSLALSIVADAVPPERRGRALGAVMSAFSVASVLGVPAGLELARLGGWRAPFLAVAGLGALVAGAAVALMPPMTAHLARRDAPAEGAALFRRPLVLASLAGTAAAWMSAFAIVPNIAAWLQLNLAFPRARLGVLYLAGGATTFGTMRLAGRMVDRLGAVPVAAAATALFLAVLAVGFAAPPSPFPEAAIVATFVGFMVANSSRNVSLNALSSRLPAPGERARFMSAQSAVQHLAAAIAAMASSKVLDFEGGRIGGMTRLATGAGLLALTLPFVVAAVARGLRRRDGSQVG